MEAQLTCPKCGSVVYSRRHLVCGRCGEKLPESAGFDVATRQRLDAMAAEEHKQAAWRSKFPGRDTSGPDPLLGA